MKRNIIGIGLVVAAAAGVWLARPAVKAAGDRRPTHDVVVIQSTFTGQIVSDTNGSSYHYGGLVIFNSSSSADAPVFPNQSIQIPVALTNTADGIALLLDQGFRMTELKDGNLMFVRTR